MKVCNSSVTLGQKEIRKNVKKKKKVELGKRGRGSLGGGEGTKNIVGTLLY